MSGILDKKSRIIDAMLTSDGRRQMAEGTFEISYVTFTDSGVAYEPDEENGHQDPTDRIYFEACNLPQDQITFEADDEGKLLPLKGQKVRVRVANNISNIKEKYADATLNAGSITAYSYNSGPRVKSSDLPASKLLEYSTSSGNAIDGNGFIYSNSTGNLTASIFISTSLPAGTYNAPTPGPGLPYVAYVGAQGGSTGKDIATAVSGAIEKFRIAGGPNVKSEVNNNSVYLFPDTNFNLSKLYPINVLFNGTNINPFSVDQGSVGGVILKDEIVNADFASQITGILTSSFDNFLELQTLASVNRVFEDQEFVLSNDELTFEINRINPNVFNTLKGVATPVNSMKSIFNDEKMSHLENFMYLPPIVKTSDTVLPNKTDLQSLRPYFLGDYPSWGDNEKKLTYSTLMSEMRDFENVKADITFDKTSISNNVIGQFFEVNNEYVNKLDVVDFGIIQDDTQADNTTSKKVYFAGKTYLDNRGTVCFVNMFTLIFSKDERSESEDITL